MDSISLHAGIFWLGVRACCPSPPDPKWSHFYMLNPGSHHAFRDIRLSKKRRLWCAYHMNTQNWKSKGRWTGPWPARQGKALPAFLVPVARQLCGWQMSEKVVFPGVVRNGRGGSRWETWGQRSLLGLQKWERGCGPGLCSFSCTVTLSTSITCSRWCLGHWTTILGTPF